MSDVIVKTEETEPVENVVETNVDTATEIAAQASDQANDTIEKALELADVMARYEAFQSRISESLAHFHVEMMREIEKINAQLATMNDSLTVLALAEADETEEESDTTEQAQQVADAAATVAVSAAQTTEDAAQAEQEEQQPLSRTRAKRRFI